MRATGGLTPTGRVVVFRALKLGDMLCAVPAFRAMRAAWPRAHITLIGLPWAREFFERFCGFFDEFREFPGYPGLPEGPADLGRIPGFFAQMQAGRYDLAIQLHGSGTRTNPLIRLFDAQRCAGFFRPGEYCPDPRTFLPWPEHGLEVRRLLRLAEHLGAPSQGESLEFPIHAADIRRLRSIPGAGDLEPGRYFCLHPGASLAARRWPASRFAAVAEALARRGLRVVLTGGAGEEALARSVARRLSAAPLDLTGRTDLGTLGALLADARLLVCNDTGVSHLADALRVPSVVISTGDNPERWAPADGQRHRVLCRPSGVEVGEASAEAEDLLRGDAADARPADPCPIEPSHRGGSPCGQSGS